MNKNDYIIRLCIAPALKRQGYGKILSGYLDGISGEYATPKGYFCCDENPEDFAAYEATFPLKEKLKLPGQLF